MWLVAGLMLIMGLVLVLPFLVKRVEEELEAFLLIMGVLSVTISGLWSWHLLKEAIIEPYKITLAVLIAGFLFRLLRPKLKKWTFSTISWFGYPVFIFLVVVCLGLLSSAITAIIAALVLVEIISAMSLPRNSEIRLVVIACFSIGLGAALTPLGEPWLRLQSRSLEASLTTLVSFFLSKCSLSGLFLLFLLLVFLRFFALKNPKAKALLHRISPRQFLPFF